MWTIIYEYQDDGKYFILLQIYEILLETNDAHTCSVLLIERTKSIFALQTSEIRLVVHKANIFNYYNSKVLSLVLK